MNHVTLFGNVGRPPELNYTQAGKARCKLSLATNERMKNSDGSWGEMTDWHQVVFWGKQAEYIAKHCTKGTQCLVSGKVRSRKYTGKDGQDRWVTEIVADRVELARGGTAQPSGDEQHQSGGSGSPHGGHQDRQDQHDVHGRQQQNGNEQAHQEQQGIEDDDDIPF